MMRLERIGDWCYGHRRWVVALWLLLLVAVVVGSRAVGSRYSDQFSLPGTEAQQANDLLKTQFPAAAGDSADIVFETRLGVNNPAVRVTMQDTLARIRQLPHVANVQSPYDSTGNRLIGRSGNIAYAEVTFDGRTSDVSKKAVLHVVDTARAAARPGLAVEAGGKVVSNAVSTGPGSSEGIGLLAAVVVLLISFGSMLAMGLPIVTALFGIGTGLGLLTFMTRLVHPPSFAPEMAAMIGIGIGIDYALIIVTRYREALHDGHDPHGAVIHAMNTAGRAILLAGSTVIVSLLGMLVTGMGFVRGLAVGTIGAVLTVMLAAITLLPALLGFVGANIDRFHITVHRTTRRSHSDAWTRWSRLIQRRPAFAAGGALIVLTALAVPLFSMRLGFTDTGNDPTSVTSRHAYDMLAHGFGPGFNGPLVLAAHLPDSGAVTTLNHLAADVRAEPGVAQVSPAILDPSGDAAIAQIIPTTSPQDPATTVLVHRLRTQAHDELRGSGITAAIGGNTAASTDFARRISERLPWLIIAVVGLSFLLLMFVFRSVVVAVKAAVMNLLSIGAAYGVIVAVFQWGWLGGVFGIGRTGPIEPWVPLMLFTILFGLSMDYEVFLLSRIRQEWLRTGENTTSVAEGLATTGRVITAAAAIMVCVFGSFVLGDMRVLKLFGLGLAAAVLVDATVVRMILVPATMEMLGGLNWWMPRRLTRLVPTVATKRHSAAPGVEAETQAGGQLTGSNNP